MRNEKFIYTLICSCLWVYLCLRTINIPIINDEAITFFCFIKPGQFLPFMSHWDANNHFLNSALSILFCNLFGNTEFTLRLPNLLSSIVYFYFLYKFASSVKHPIIRWSFIITLLSANFLLEFFTLCRGYGISMALLLPALWFLIQYLKENKTRHLFLCLLLFFLTISANLNFLISGIIIIGILLLNVFLSKKIFIKKNVFQALIIFFFGIIPIICFAKLIFIVRAKGLLYIGGTNGFIHDTLNSLANAFLEFSNSYIISFIIFLFLLISILMIISCIKLPVKEIVKSNGMVFFILLIGNVIANILLHRFFGINYPPDRAAMYYFIFFTGSFYFIIDTFASRKHYRFLLLFCLPFLFFPLNFLYSINIDYVKCWKNDQFPFRFYQKIASSSDTYFRKLPPIISGDCINEIPWYYFNYKCGGKCNILQKADFPCMDADFILANKENYPGLFRDYDSIDYYDRTKLYLLKRKKPLIRELLDSVANIYSKGVVNDESFNVWSGKADTLINRSLYIGFYLTLYSPQKPFNTHLVVSVNDKNSNNIRYETIKLDWLKKQWDGKQNNFVNSMLLHNLPNNSHSITVYLWNIEKAPFSIANGSCYVYQLK